MHHGQSSGLEGRRAPAWLAAARSLLGEGTKPHVLAGTRLSLAPRGFTSQDCCGDDLRRVLRGRVPGALCVCLCAAFGSRSEVCLEVCEAAFLRAQNGTGASSGSGYYSRENGEKWGEP